MRRRLWWTALVVVLLHQLAQKLMGWHWSWADHYLDPLLCMPLVLGLIEWEWSRWFGKKRLRPIEVALLTVLLALLFEWGFPSWSPGFTADAWDVLAYSVGSVLWAVVNYAKA